MEFSQNKKPDANKPRWDLLPIEPIEQIVEVLTFSTRKYVPENWRDIKPFRRIFYAAMMRHLSAWRQGECVDPESGLGHLAHAACNLLFLIWGDDNIEPDDSDEDLFDEVKK